MESKSQNPFEGAKFDVEHALNIYADSFCTFPVQHLYNKDFVNALKNNGRAFHIYAKDFLALVAEICIDDLPFSLCSENVKPKHYHIITYDLQNDAERRAFLGL